MSGEPFEIKMHVIPLEGYDIMLGVHWMTQVSPIIFDYSLRRIIVNHLGRKVNLQPPQITPKVNL